MEIHVKQEIENALYQGVENKYLIKRLIYLVQYTTKYDGTQNEREEIEHIIHLLEQQDIITYLQRREKASSERLGELKAGSAIHFDAAAKQAELLDIMCDLKIRIDHN